MNSPMEVTNTILINASITDVWDALINPEKTSVYMFGCRTVSDWAPGSTLTWEAEVEGQKMVFVTGKVVAYKPPDLLRYTVFDPNSGMEDIPANHLQVCYSLEEEKGQIKLTVSQTGFENAAMGKERFEEVYNNGIGWDPILQQIDKLVKNQKG